MKIILAKKRVCDYCKTPLLSIKKADRINAKRWEYYKFEYYCPKCNRAKKKENNKWI